MAGYMHHFAHTVNPFFECIHNVKILDFIAPQCLLIYLEILTQISTRWLTQWMYKS